MGLAEMLLGKDNPFAQWTSNNQGFLGALGAGVGSGQNIQSGLSSALQMMPQAKQYDVEQRRQAEADAKVLAQTNSTKAWLEQNHPDLAQMVDAGMDVGQAWNTALDRMSPQTAEMKNPYMSAGDGQFFNWQTGEWVSNPNAPQSQGAAPSGYMWTEGGLQPIPGGPADPANPLNSKRAGGTPSPTIAKEIFEADEAVLAGDAVVPALARAIELNETAWAGPFADQRSAVGALFGDANATNTQELKNLVTAQALEQLKAVFGAMPTEGERKILLEIQGSVDQAPEVRKRIYERAMAAAQRRHEFNKQKAAGLRSGEYFDEGFGQTAPGNSGDGWSVIGVE